MLDGTTCTGTAFFLRWFVLTGGASPAIDPEGLAEAMPPSATAYEGIAPPVKTIAEDTPYAVPAAQSTSAG